MAILKIISHNKNTAGTRRLLSYVLDPKKTAPHLCAVSGDFRDDDLTPQTVYQNYARVREQYNNARAGGRICTHGTVSFAPGEVIPEQAVEFAAEFVERIYPNHQVLMATHIDTGDRIHFHFVVNCVSYLDGSMLHTSKHDLDCAKRVCNEMCKERGWSVARKGHHVDGTAFAAGEISTWDKNTYHQIVSNPKKSWMADLVVAVQECLAHARSREEFCEMLEREHGWRAMWKDSKKNITFTDAEGHKVRDSNLSKTFHLEVSKDTLEKRFAQKKPSAHRSRRGR